MAQFAETRTVVSTLYGGTGGALWDDGILFDKVEEIILRHGKSIDSISLVYDRQGKDIIAQKHGENSSNSEEHIKLDYMGGEVITKVSGQYEKATWIQGDPVVIRSLKFVTNCGEYGPYGMAEGKPFTFTVKQGEKLIGFFGRSAACLDAIGFHVTSANARA